MHWLQGGIGWEYELNTAKEKEITVYKAELEELKTKEVAYKQTIEKGDAILEKVCYNHPMYWKYWFRFS